MSNVYIINGARTAFTEFGGSFAKVDAATLGTATAIEALKRSKVKPEQVDHVVYGNVIHTGKNASYLSRHIGLNAGVPQEVPALTLNRLCGSGMQAVVTAAQTIMLEEANIILAGGAENMSQSPYSNFEQRFNGAKLGNIQFDDMLQATLVDQYTGKMIILKKMLKLKLWQGYVQLLKRKVQLPLEMLQALMMGQHLLLLLVKKQ